MIKWLSKLFGPVEATDTESFLFPGVVKPTTTLAHMIVGKMLTSDSCFFTEGENKVFRVNDDCFLEWRPRRPSETLIVYQDGVKHTLDEKQCEELCAEYSMSQGQSRTHWRSHEINNVERVRKYVLKNYKYVPKPKYLISCSLDIQFDDRELKILEAGIYKALSLKEERDKVAKVSENQQKAVNAIEKFMGVGKNADNSLT